MKLFSMKKKLLVTIITFLFIGFFTLCVATFLVILITKNNKKSDVGYKQIFNNDSSNQEDKSKLDHYTSDEFIVYYPEGYASEQYQIAVVFFNRFNDRNNNRPFIAVTTMTLEGDETKGFNYFYENTDLALENCRQQASRKVESREAESELTQTIESYELIKNDMAFGCRYKVSDIDEVGEFLEVAVKGNANDKKIQFYYVRIFYTAREDHKEFKLLREAFKNFTIKANKDNNLSKDIIIGDS